MCGVAGILCNPGGRPEAAVLEAMTRTLHRRGPDDEGFYLDGPVGLGHRRLSIVDLDTGHQPIFNEDEKVAVICNGEIYNYLSLRRELETAGHRFSTRSDTEVIVHAYEEWGDQVIARLRGMFTVVIWDSVPRRLLLARDRMGQKPLFYSRGDSGFFFASELKALFENPAVTRRIDPRSLSRYLVYEFVPAPRSILEGVKKLMPAHYMVVEPGREPVISRYWSMSYPADGPQGPREHWPDRFWELFVEAVSKRLMSDVPLGVFLSGGLDSSALVAAMAELMDPALIKTFSIGFEEASFDESGYARTVARHFGTDHREDVLSVGVMLEILPEVLDFLDEPFGDASIIPTYLLSRFTRQHVTVALGGDGGDELLSGYPTFWADGAAEVYQRFPGPIRGMIEAVARRLPVSTRNFSLDFKVKQFLKGMSYPSGARRHQVWLGSFSPAQLQPLLSRDLREELADDDPLDEISRRLEGVDFRDRMDLLNFFYCHFYLADDILAKVDRASMACSLEARAPFMDRDVVEYLNCLPGDMKLKGRCTKYVLRRAVEKKLPAICLSRGKKGFGIPVARWLKGRLRPLMMEQLSPERLKRDGMLDPDRVQRMVSEHLEGRADHRKPLWTLLVLQWWKERYGAEI